MRRILDVLKQYYGYESFRKGQEELINNILNGRDVLGIMPTGGGKSICYQIPAQLLDGITIVISPLISLMKDQVDTLTDMGIKAAYINSTLSSEEFDRVLKNAKSGDYKLIYVAPERLETRSFIDFLEHVNISMVAVDEAHCVSQWGHDFRPSYRRISELIDRLTIRPIIAAYTATATEEVKQDIIKLLNLTDAFVLTTGFNRENLYFEVEKPQNKFRTLRKYLNQHKKESGIIYCSTRKTVESVTDKLNLLGFNATKYHAGVPEHERTANQEDFIYDRKQIMVATNAFGMGIDKSNIRYVVHYNMPKNMEAYYQEAGRAGRDGLESECVLLFSASDIVTNKFLISNMNEQNQEHAYKKLNEMTDYCNTDKCLRSYILIYFGDTDTEKECNHCSNCNNDIELTDITVESQKIMSCVKRMNERYGANIVASVLKGSKAKKVRDFGLEELSTHGIMKEYHADSIKEIISFLIAEDYLGTRGTKYPTLALTTKSKDVLFGNEKVLIKRVIDKHKEEKDSHYVEAYDETLFEKLRSLRTGLSGEQGVPPFVIFSDAALQDMCRKFPKTDNEFLSVSGVGEHKLSKYGQLFMDIIKDYTNAHDINVDQYQTTESLETKKKSKSTTTKESKLETYDLYKEGLSIDEIKTKRGLSQTTIENHLFECFKEGYEIDFDRFINKDFETEIVDVIKEVGGAKLKPIKEALPDEVTYTDIKFTISKYNL
ncbi:DNA helicase RecQ [Haloplasma contractile]|uniref:DNA helicase RecQ n=1 Tax=Haloplasma contractile SSD-17B TaxID=1033810 RepID=F7Q0P7_9MOLU|nr:DNA helicase RecQ [Haloplasma contractile]ERJ11957.1 ATP-dependent DNA helicase protein [Haloplasma contractile SSD-17B]